MDHENSQQAREFLRTYVNGNRKLITDWLDGSGNAEDVGAHLLCIMLERLAVDEKPDLGGIACGYIMNLFQTVPGGDLAAGRLVTLSFVSMNNTPLMRCYYTVNWEALRGGWNLVAWASPEGPRNSELCHRQRSALFSEKLTAQEGILINEIVIADCCRCGANYASARTNLASLNFGKNNALQIHSGKLCGNFFNQSLLDIYWQRAVHNYSFKIQN